MFDSDACEEAIENHPLASSGGFDARNRHRAAPLLKRLIEGSGAAR